jgi:hypothetical protein
MLSVRPSFDGLRMKVEVATAWRTVFLSGRICSR